MVKRKFEQLIYEEIQTFFKIKRSEYEKSNRVWLIIGWIGYMVIIIAIILLILGLVSSSIAIAISGIIVEGATKLFAPKWKKTYDSLAEPLKDHLIEALRNEKFDLFMEFADRIEDPSYRDQTKIYGAIQLIGGNVEDFKLLDGTNKRKGDIKNESI